MKNIMFTVFVFALVFTASANAKRGKRDCGSTHHYICKGDFDLVSIDGGERIWTYPTKCIVAKDQIRESGFFCQGDYDLIDPGTKDKQWTYPAKCEDAIGDLARTGRVYCKDTYDLVNVYTGEKIWTYPTKCKDSI